MTIRRAMAFGMSILAYDVADVSAAARGLGLKVTSLEKVLSEADIISVHIPHIPKTANMFNADLFGKMKTGAYFINTSRGGLVDEKALVDAIKSGHLAGAGLDVFAEEPIPADNQLLALPNVVCTPHVAGDTSTTMLSAISMNITQIFDCFEGKKPQNLLNPKAWDQARIHNL